MSTSQEKTDLNTERELAVQAVLDACEVYHPDELESVEGSYELQKALYKLIKAYKE